MCMKKSFKILLNHLGSEKKKLRGKLLIYVLLEELREVGIWFLRYQHNWLIQFIGRTKALIDLEAYCRDTGQIVPWISTS